MVERKVENYNIGIDDSIEDDDPVDGEEDIPLRPLQPQVVGKLVEVEKDPQLPQMVSREVEPTVPMLFGVPLKWLSLVVLTCQTTIQAFAIKFARNGGTPYLNSTCVFFAEVLKTIVSGVLLSAEKGGVQVAVEVLWKDLKDEPLQAIKMVVPALAYIVQNNLIFYSLEKLSMAVQQVTYQMKILTAGLMSCLLLGKHLSPTKWGALVVLVVGVIMVQFPKQETGTGNTTDTARIPSQHGSLGDGFSGFIAVVFACFTSGFAGAYMEGVLKSNKSIWHRNVQLGLCGSVVGLASVYVQTPETISAKGLTYGYTWRVVMVIFCLGGGGLLCAVVLKYADNILRQFSTALSIILTSAVSWIALQEYEPDTLFAVGTLIVIAATVIYNLV